MRKRFKSGLAPLVVAAVLLLHIAALHVFMTADRETVFFEGQPIHNSCSFKEHFGVPCPACGISRSLVLTVHGDVATASALNPGGPIGVLTALYFSGGMLWLALRRSPRTVRVIQWSTTALGIVLIAAVGVHWIRELVAANRLLN